MSGAQTARPAGKIAASPGQVRIAAQAQIDSARGSGGNARASAAASRGGRQKASGGAVLRPLGHVAEIRTLPTLPQATTHANPLLTSLQNGPAMPVMPIAADRKQRGSSKTHTLPSPEQTTRRGVTQETTDGVQSDFSTPPALSPSPPASSIPSGDGAVQVALRIRPLNQRETEGGNDICCTVGGDTSVVLQNRKAAAAAALVGGKDTGQHVFTFDFVFGPGADLSIDGETFERNSQERVYKCLGEAVLVNAFAGFNCSLLAYGQTGAGKSHSMMGYAAERTLNADKSRNEEGLIPRLVNSLFAQAAANASADPNLSYHVQVSYLEIYAEAVQDLLDKSKKNLPVRQHPSKGPYVDGLTITTVSTYADVAALMERGSALRVTAATNMNAQSSRSHAVFTIILTAATRDPEVKLSSKVESKLQLVDLAGSERQETSGATGVRLKEAAMINLSLTCLGRVISALAAQSQKKRGGGASDDTFVPFRDSALTWLLKESLGGNAKTIMLACCSPSSLNFEETLSTLRYASAAKHIRNKAIVNEDANAALIRKLRQEIDALKAQLMAGGSAATGAPSLANSEAAALVEALRAQLLANAQAMAEKERIWAEKLQASAQLSDRRLEELQAQGASLAQAQAQIAQEQAQAASAAAAVAAREAELEAVRQRQAADRSEIASMAAAEAARIQSELDARSAALSAKDVAHASELAADRARMEAEREEFLEAKRLAAQRVASAEEARLAAEAHAHRASLDHAAATNAALTAQQAEGDRLAADAEARVQRERHQRDVMAQRLAEMEAKLAEMEAARVAIITANEAQVRAAQAAAEAALATALADEEARRQKIETKRVKELGDAACYNFRAEALPNSYCDLRLTARVTFNSKQFETSMLQAAFAMDAEPVGAPASSAVTSASGRPLFMHPWLELLCLRSNRVMVSPVVWRQLIEGEKAATMQYGHASITNSRTSSENVVRVGDNVWIVADRVQPSRISIENGNTLVFDAKDVLSRIESLCHNEYLRPILIRVQARPPANRGPLQLPVILGEFMTTLRTLESSVVGNKSWHDISGPVRTDTKPFDMVLPPAAEATGTSSGSASAAAAVVGSCVFTMAQELIFVPFPSLLASMEEKRVKHGSSSLFFPRHCKMQLSVSCNGLTTEHAPLHACVLLFRTEKEEKVDASGPIEGDPDALQSRDRSSRAVSGWRAFYDGRSWCEIARSNLVSWNEDPEFDCTKLEMDDFRSNVRASVMVVVVNATYIGSRGSMGGATAVQITASTLDLARCELLGGGITSLLNLCSASGVPAASTRVSGPESSVSLTSSASSSSSFSSSSSSSSSSIPSVVPSPKTSSRKDGSKSGKSSRRKNHRSSGADGLLLMDLTDLHGELKLFSPDSAIASVRNALNTGVTLPPVTPSSRATVAATLTFSRVSLFTPSTQLADLERAAAKRARKLAKLAEEAQRAQERSDQERVQQAEAHVAMHADLALHRAEMERRLIAMAST